MATPDPLQSPISLEKNHDVSTFDCGAAPLNDCLRKYAWQNHQNRSARTYVALRGNRVVAYYSIAAGSVRRDETTARVPEDSPIIRSMPATVHLIYCNAVTT